MKLTASYPQREHVVQYQETDFNFISRLMEHEGIFYFFSEDKLIIADSSVAHQSIVGESKIVYRLPSGMESAGQEAVHALTCRQQVLPHKVILKDYNWRKPSLDLKSEADAVKKGQGIFMEHGNHYKDTNEGAQLAKVRSEEIKCRQRLIMGESDCRGFRSGFKYNLAEHYRSDFNIEYLLTEVNHYGSQSGAFVNGLPGTEGGEEINYRNEFVCIPGDVPFRPQRTTSKPRFYGVMNAKVDAAGSGQYAEIDNQGRYKVILPFDLSGKSGGKASRYVRMAQPYAGANYGMHFPLHKGTEVLLTFVDGDPDRPIISGSVPNPETSSPVTTRNQTRSVIRTGGGNEIAIEDSDGGQLIKLSSPTENTFFRIGASNSGNPSGIDIGSGGHLTTTVGGHEVRQVTGNTMSRSLKWN